MKTIRLLAIVPMLATILLATSNRAVAQTYTETSLHSFGDGSVPADGSLPVSTLARGNDGNLYGTTVLGGAAGQGVVFKITPSGVTTTLHSFSDGTVVHDGSSPHSIVLGKDGNFYGTCAYGGSTGTGAHFTGSGCFFKMTPAGAVTILHSFGDGSVVNDGVSPVSDARQATDGNFYGTTSAGGSAGHGTLYKVTPLGAVTILHSCQDGSVPGEGAPYNQSLLQAADGNFYGTSELGGTANKGTVFKMTPAGVVTIIHSFSDGSVANEGYRPYSGLAVGPDGNLYGLTPWGGALGYGSFFKITTTGAVSLVYSFDAPENSTPEAPLCLGGDGNFYSTTLNYFEQINQAIPFDYGTAFRVSPTGSFKTIHSFASGATDGETPSGLTQGVDGNLYGCTVGGGTAANGTVFRVSYGGGTAHFVKVDASTQGNWRDAYGADGYNVIGDTSTGNPHYRDYVSANPGTHNSGVWAATSLSPACLQTAAAGSAQRLAGIWFQTSWTLTVNTTGTRQLALYLLDQPNAGYAETITIRNAMTGAVLDTRSASSFGGGAYYVWNVSGYVNITFTSTAGHWAVLSGIFFGGAPGSHEPSTPSGVTVAPSGGGLKVSWTASSGATSYNVYRGTTAGGESTTAIATGVKTTSYANTGLTPNTTYYYKVIAVNAVAGSIASAEASATAPPPSSTATFVKTDTSTQGSWKGVYGADGWNVIGDVSGNNPTNAAYATVTAATHNSGVWASTSTDPRCLQKAAIGSSDRMAGVWFQTTWSMNVNVTGTHQLALYFLDLNNAGYAETVTIKDTATGAVLDTRPVSAFSNGVYEVWNVSGNVTVTFAPTAGKWSVVNGIFFG